MSAAKNKKRMKQAVLATLSNNRVGIVSEVTSFLQEHDANLLASHTARLGNLYGGFFHFEAPEQGMKTIRSLYKRKLKEFQPRFSTSVAAKVPTDDSAHLLKIYSFDRPGIVSKVADLLQGARVDIRHVAGLQYPAPEVGAPLFVLDMKLDLPPDLSEDELRKQLEALADANSWDLDFQSVSPRPRGRRRTSRQDPKRTDSLRIVREAEDEQPEQISGLA